MSDNIKRDRLSVFTDVVASGTELRKRSILFEGEKFKRSSLQAGYKVNFATLTGLRTFSTFPQTQLSSNVISSSSLHKHTQSGNETLFLFEIAPCCISDVKNPHSIFRCFIFLFSRIASTSNLSKSSSETLAKREEAAASFDYNQKLLGYLP